MLGKPVGISAWFRYLACRPGATVVYITGDIEVGIGKG